MQVCLLILLWRLSLGYRKALCDVSIVPTVASAAIKLGVWGGGGMGEVVIDLLSEGAKER